ncbi:hypothetical protein [Massilia scottii]|uniref:hypothetical protein n=1 Tax=Massilia scottii TaxID=3057166 RepID=UPI002796777C|nr:hypothetical protein [Massilia sp. CCM 9029]MDQ1829228.1 hypothetical protein [Massilia sp. CCM 9029]
MDIPIAGASSMPSPGEVHGYFKKTTLYFHGASRCDARHGIKNQFTANHDSSSAELFRIRYFI